MNTHVQRRAWLKAAAGGPSRVAFLGYLFLAGLALWTAVKNPFATVVGVPHLHVWEELWHFWWTRTALTTGQSPFFSPLLGFPSGMNVFYDMSSISLPMASVPLQALLGVVGAYNAMALLALTAAAFGAYRLCVKVSGKPLPSFLGGIVFGFSPFLQTELSNGMMENLLAFAFLPWFVLCLLRLHAHGRWTDGLAAGLIAGVAALSSWYFLVMAALLSAMFLGAAFLADRDPPGASVPLAPPGGEGGERDARTTDLFRAYAVMAAVVAVMIVVPLTALTTGPTLERGVPWQDCVKGPLLQKSCIDILRLFTHGSVPPPPAQPSDDVPPELLPFGVYVGKITLLLVLLAILMPAAPTRPRSAFRVPGFLPLPRSFWTTGFLIALLLMLGPYLNIGGRVDWGSIRIPLLDRLLLCLPGTGRLLALHNYRFASCVMLFAAILVTLAANRILSAFRPRLQVLFALFTAWLLIADFGNSAAREHLLFLPTSDTSLPKAYAAIAQEPEGAIFNIPASSGANARPDIRGLQMFHQLAHHRPIACDPIYILEPPENETALARAARQMARGLPWQLDAEALAEDLDTLATQGFRFVVVHLNFLSDADAIRLRTLMQSLLSDPIATGPKIEIYRLRREVHEG